jgi:hypothetical protein
MHVTEALWARRRTSTTAQRLAVVFWDLLIRRIEEDANRPGG